jgi:hypothetical protein
VKAHPKATHEATGRYRAVAITDDPPYSWAIACPDGTEYMRGGPDSFVPFQEYVDALNDEDRRQRQEDDE